MRKFTIAGLALLMMLLATVPAGAELIPEEVFADGIRVEAIPLPEMESGTLTEIPVRQEEREVIAPYEDCYLYPSADSEDACGYASPSMTVSIGWGRAYETDFVYAWVRLAHPNQIRTKLVSSLREEKTVAGASLAKRVSAVFAINGDYCQAKGAIMRQGEMLRNNCNGESDVLVVDGNGDLIVLPKATVADVEAVADQAVNMFTFGPALVINGEIQPVVSNRQKATELKAQRMAICQTGMLEYLMISSQGPEQFASLMSLFPEVQTGYNLDGGSSSTMVFRKNGKNWVKINTPKNGKVRPLKDIIYFAEAWQAE